MHFKSLFTFQNVCMVTSLPPADHLLSSCMPHSIQMVAHEVIIFNYYYYSSCISSWWSMAPILIHLIWKSIFYVKAGLIDRFYLLNKFNGHVFNFERGQSKAVIILNKLHCSPCNDHIGIKVFLYSLPGSSVGCHKLERTNVDETFKK